MKKEKAPVNLRKYSIMVIVFVVSIVLIGVSLSYAYFSARFSGFTDTGVGTAAILNITSSITTAPAIDSSKLAIIDALDYKTKSERVLFTVTNETTSNIKGKYTVSLVEMSLSKNLFSKYFKWELIVNEGTDNERVFRGDFADSTVVPEGTEDLEKLTDLSKSLISEEDALTLNIGDTDDMKFYIWLENDEAVNQLYLTNGTFSGKISISAVPTKD